MAGIITRERQNPSDPVTARNFADALHRLEASTKELSNLLKPFSDYNREAYKMEIRQSISAAMTPETATAMNIKKKFSQVFPGKPFYTELVEELINEDYSPEAESLRQKLLAKLAVEGKKAADPKSKTPASYKPLLIEGLNAIGSAGATLEEILLKLDGNHEVHQNKKKTFGEKIKVVLAKVFNKEPDAVIYICESIDPDKGPVRDKIDYQQFRDDIAKKSKILLAVAAKGTAAAKLESMQEAQLMELLDRNIRDLQIFHRQLDALDDFFKTEADADDRAKIRGIKPELSTIKNAVSKATNKKHDFMAVREEAEQFKQLGIEA